MSEEVRTVKLTCEYVEVEDKSREWNVVLG
jgi:hypothetical protein